MAAPTTDHVSRSAWAPLASPVYRALWIAQLVSNLGTWMQTVGAQWMLVSDPGAAVLVPLVQTATTLPVMLLALPSGVLADLTDRRRLLIATQSAMAAGVGMLAVLTGVGLATPAVLLILLFLIGCGQALTAPAWQAIQPELVPREQIPAAAALTSLSMNSARAIGPAVAGALVSLSGPTTVFALNAVSFIGIVAVLAWWQRPSEERLLPTERPLSALNAGRRYIRSSPVVRRILLRAVLFIAPASALWALLPVIADRQLHLSSAGYGVLLGALGFGAVCGATVLSRLQLAFGRNALLTVGAIGFSVAAAVLALVPVFAVAVAVLVIGGLSWLLTLSTLNAAMQLSLPAWVRARGLSVYQLVFMGGQAVGSLVWGLVAGAAGSVTALVVSAGLLAFCAVSLLWWPLHPGTGDLDVEPSAHWGEPALVFEPEPPDGPVVVLRSYRVDPADQAAFIEAMQRVGRSRQRTGAAQWGLFRSGEHADTFVEAFMVRSWEEHLHQHVTRQTGQDLLAEQVVEKYVTGEPALQHLIAVNQAAAAPTRLRPRLRRRRSAPTVAPPTNGPHNRPGSATDSG